MAMSQTAPTLDEPAQTPPGPLLRLWRDARVLLIAMVAVLAFHTVAFQPFTIPSSSMEPGLITGDYIVVSKWPYGWSRASFYLNPPLWRGRLFGHGPARGDVVVFRLPRDPGQTWIKRVIGLPGDRIQVRAGTVVVNDRPIPRTPLDIVPDRDSPDRQVLRVREALPGGRAWITYDGGSGLQGDDTGVYVVPAGQYFMMGDNRDNSLDSRWPRDMGVGLQPAENIFGRAELIVATWSPGASLFKPWTWFDVRPDRVLRPIR
jgi:signal peptidase I